MIYNHLKTLAFFLILSMAFTGLGSLFGGAQGLVVGFSISIVVLFILYWFSDRLILAAHQARELSATDSLGLHKMIERLALRAGLPIPKIYLIPDHSPNAFAVGRDPHHASLAVTQGLLGILNYQELEGVVAQVLAHIKQRDMLLGSITALVASCVMFGANMLKGSALFGKIERNQKPNKTPGAIQLIVTSMVAPVAAMLIRLTVSGTRIYSADRNGALYCGSSEPLANALRKIHNTALGIPLSRGSLATAHLYVINPFSTTAFIRLFNTHPSVESRIERLLEMRLRVKENQAYQVRY